MPGSAERLITGPDGEEHPVQGNFEGMDIIFRSSKLKACELTGALASSELQPATKVRITLDAVVVDVDHKSVKNVAGVMERIHVLETIPESGVIVETL